MYLLCPREAVYNTMREITIYLETVILKHQGLGDAKIPDDKQKVTYFVCLSVRLSVRNAMGKIGFTQLILRLDLGFFKSIFPSKWGIFKNITYFVSLFLFNICSIIYFVRLSVPTVECCHHCLFIYSLGQIFLQRNE